jgi:ATP-dependent Lhr-like helicase
VVVEQFSDALGDQRLVIHSCFGGRINSAWALALSQTLRERLGRELEVQVNEDGILFRIAQADREPPLDLLRALGPDEARRQVDEQSAARTDGDP